MTGILRHPLRVVHRLARFTAAATSAWLASTPGGRRAPASRHAAGAAWLHTWGPRTLRAMGIHSAYEGRPPTNGLVVCNHLSYVDVPVLSSAAPMMFVAKADVARWPAFGALARCGGTLFIKREARAHVAEITDAFAPIIHGGTVVVVFPEGTSSGGDTVLPFRSSLLEPAAANDWWVTPAWITYELDDGTVSDDVAYWRDMTFATHFLNLLSKRRIVGRVFFGEPVRGIRDRKELARRLHAEVCAMMNCYRKQDERSLEHPQMEPASGN